MSAPAPALVSVIIPTWQEEATLETCLRSLLECEGPIEILVADAGSTDRTLEVATKLEPRGVRVVHCGSRGRATQMNEAADEARGSILWFVHADSRVHRESATRIRTALEEDGTALGAFRFAVDSRRFRFRVLERAVALRTRRLRCPYGDQGLFVRRALFERIGGYADQPLLEDLHLVRRLRREGSLYVVDLPLETSARRWEERGFLRTTWQHLRILTLDRLGVPPERLRRVREHPDPAR